MKPLPSWIKIRLACTETSALVQSMLAQTRLNTVCESALCPNKHECFARGTATVMIMGSSCTRRCRFCAVRHGTPSSLDTSEPGRVAQFAARLGLKHVVVTSVTRDDIPDGGANMFARTVAELKKLTGATIEVLTPDFRGCGKSLALVLAERPDVFNHNLETVQRLQPSIRPQASYACSLNVLRVASEWTPPLRVKSGLMVGLGETDAELFETMRDLFRVGCRYLTIGQYLAPSKNHAPVARYVHPQTFDEYKAKALDIGFAAVVSGPLVRSSYLAEKMLARTVSDRLAEEPEK